MFNQYIRQTMVYIICLQLSLGSVKVFAAESVSTSALQEMLRIDYAPLLSPEVKESQRKLEYLNQLISSGNADNIPTQIFGLLDQSVEVKGSDGQWLKIKFADGYRKIPVPQYTKLKFSFDPQTKEVIGNAVSGADRFGENGVVVARHRFAGYDPVAVVNNNYFVVILEKSGKISTIPMDLFVASGFQEPVPVFKNLNGKGQLDFTTNEVGTEFLTLVSETISENERDPKSFTKMRGGEELFDAGELAIWEKGPNNERLNVKRIPLAPLMALTSVGMKYYYAAFQLVTLDQNSVIDMKTLLEEMFDSEERSRLNHLSKNVSAEEAALLLRMPPQKIAAAFFGSQRLSKEQTKLRDQFTRSEWYKLQEGLQSNAELAVRLSAEARSAEKSRLNRIARFMRLQGVIDPREFVVTEHNYHSFLSKKKIEEQMKETTSMILKRKAMSWALIGAPAIAFFGFPFGYDRIEAMRQVKSLSYIYENMMPDVLKNEAYRSTLVASTAIQLALIPLVFSTALLFKASMASLAFSSRNSTTKFGLFVKDFAAKYNELSSTQLMITMNIRMMSVVIIPYWQVLISGIAGQKTFFQAIGNRISPFKTVSPESTVGQKAGLAEPVAVGFNRPFDKSEIKKRETIQGLIVEQRRKAELIAFYLATRSVSEKYGYDPVTLYMASGLPAISPEAVRKLLDDPQSIRERDLLSSMMIETVAKMDDLDLIDLRKTITPEQLMRLNSISTNVAQQLSQMSGFATSLQRLSIQFKSKMTGFLVWLANLGRTQSEFYRKIIPSKKTTRQVVQEFVPDQSLVSIQTGIVGDMADLSKPENLMARADHWSKTSEAQLVGDVQNAYIHLSSAAAVQTLMYDTIQREKELRYEPRENYMLQNREWAPNIFSAASEYMKFLILDPTKADVGGTTLKRYVARLNTIFSMITILTATRLLFADASFQSMMHNPELLQTLLSSSMRAVVITYFCAHLMMNWVWDFVQTGNRASGNDAENNKALLQKMQIDLSRGIAEPDPKKSAELISSGQAIAVTSYVKSNPKALVELSNLLEDFAEIEVAKHFNDGLGGNGLIQSIKNRLKMNKIDPASMQLLGLVARLVDAKANGNFQEVEATRKALLAVYEKSDSTELTTELNKLNAQGLLDFTQQHPPVPTLENSKISWFVSIVIGAVGTTWLSSYWTPIMTNDKLLHQPGYVSSLVAAGIAFSGLFYLGLSKAAWENIHNPLREKAKELAWKRWVGIPWFEHGFLNAVRGYVSEKATSTAIYFSNPAKRAGLSKPVVTCNSLMGN